MRDMRSGGEPGDDASGIVENASLDHSGTVFVGPETVLEHPRSSKNFLDTLEIFASSVLTPLDGLGSALGRLGLSVAPYAAGGRHIAYRGAQAMPGGADDDLRPSSSIGSFDGVLKRLGSFQRALGEGRGAFAQTGESQIRPGAWMSAIRDMRDLYRREADHAEVGLSHAQLMRIGGEPDMATPQRSIGSVAPSGIMATRAGAMARRSSTPDHAEAGSIAFGSVHHGAGNEHSSAADKISDTRKRAVASAAAFDNGFEAYLIRQARLPPAGMTAFDPRLTPAWAGVKLPG